jgi:hypothetical protein
MQEILPSFPVETDNGTLMGLDEDAQSYFVYYDPLLTRVVIFRYRDDTTSGTFELWDVQLKKTLWIKTSPNILLISRPVWSSDGAYFAFILSPDNAVEKGGVLYLVDRDGHEMWSLGRAAPELSFSPDGKSLAMRWWKVKDNLYNPIAIIEIASHKTTVYDLVDDHSIPNGQYSIWSPDSRYIALNEIIEDETNNRVIIFDIVNKRAFELIRGVSVLGWMSSPK